MQSMVAESSVRESTRDLILDATDRLMGRYGFRKMSMDDVAKEAGVSKRSIYVHFENKEDVGLSSIGRVVERVHDELTSIAASSDSPTKKLGRMLERRVMGRIEQVKDYAHSLDELFEVVRPAYMARRARFFELEKALIVNVIAEGVRLGEFECEDTALTAESLLLATNAFLPYSLSVRELGALETIAARLRAMTVVLLRGVTAPTLGNTK